MFKAESKEAEGRNLIQIQKFINFGSSVSEFHRSLILISVEYQFPAYAQVALNFKLKKKW